MYFICTVVTHCIQEAVKKSLMFITYFFCTGVIIISGAIFKEPTAFVQYCILKMVSIWSRKGNTDQSNISSTVHLHCWVLVQYDCCYMFPVWLVAYHALRHTFCTAPNV